MANQAWQITSPGQLTLTDLGATLPKPGPKQTLIRIHAVSLNYRDKLVVEHSQDYPIIAEPNLVPASDGAGVVEEAGLGSHWNKGDRIIVQPNAWTGTDERDYELANTMGGGRVEGTLRRFKIVDDTRLIKAPDGLSFEEASTIYTAGATAYRALFYNSARPLKPGMTVLTQGTGGVSCYAIMVAAAAGATVIATSSSDEKLETARKLGATHLINYRKQPNWADEVLKVTNGKGVDIVVDVVGAETIEDTIKATSYGGVIVVVGLLGANPTKPVNIMLDILYTQKTISGHLGAGSREMTEELSALMERHRLHPPIAETFEFERADKGLDALVNLSAPGKIVVRV